MASFNDCLTTEGQRIFALMARGSKVTFTRVVLGDGIKQDGVLESQVTDVINPVATLNIDSVTKSADNKVTIRSVFSNAQTVDPFYLREKGVYATTDGTDECLVFYANNGVLAEYIDVAKTQLIEKIIRTVIIFSESDNINITMSSSGYGPPTIMTDSTFEDFIGKGESVEEGSEIIVTNGDGEKEIYVYMGGDPFDMNNYLQVYGTRALVVMHEYIPIEERIKGSMYLLLGRTRRLMVKVFKKFYNREYTNTDTNDTLTLKVTTEKTTNVSDGNNYRLLCKNLSILQAGENPERLEGKFYFIADSE